MSILLILILILFIALIFLAYKKKISRLTAFTVIIYIVSFIPFAFGLLSNSYQYNIPIDPIDNGYTPFGGKHIYSLLQFLFLYYIANYLLWIKNEKLPPLTWVLTCSIVIIGIIINIFITLQTSLVLYSNNTYNNKTLLNSIIDSEITLFTFYPLLSIIISIYIMIKSFNKVIDQFKSHKYINSTLNILHTILLKRNSYHLFVVVLIFPVFMIITLILMLFGQDHDSMIKVFTDTTTWRFSQQEHPPYLDHRGHYLCTVAARGNPKIVKPLRIGKRHGKPIIINRQLMIANAFEEMIQISSKKTHHFIRENYDKYGYNLSKKINTPLMSNLVYILMKPLEWIFLLCLYLCIEKPESLIKKQYK